MSQWLITQGDNQFSVSGLSELKEMAERGDLKAGDMIQPPGATDWIYAAEVPQLAAILDNQDDGLDAPSSGRKTMIAGVVLGAVVLLFGGAALWFAQSLPRGDEVLIGDGGLTYSQMLVTDAGQSLLADPDPRGRSLVALKVDDVLDLMSKRGEFYRARTRGGQEGWVNANAVIPVYALGGQDVRDEYDPLYNPDRYVEVANASWQQLPPEKAGDETAITVFQFNLWNSSKYVMTDVVLAATIKDAKGSELAKLEFQVEGKIPNEATTMVGTLQPEEDDEEGERRLLTAFTFSELSADDPDLQLRYVDGVEVELATDAKFTNAQIDIVELRAIPDDEAAGVVNRK